MEQKLFEYTFSHTDYAELQKSILSKDILGSSWSGEESISIYKDRVIHTINNKIVGNYAVSDYRAFITIANSKSPADALSGNWRTIVLLKKKELESMYAKYIYPSLQGSGNFVKGYVDGAKFKILKSKEPAFVEALKKILPETTLPAELPVKGTVFRLIISVLVLAIIALILPLILNL
jgi:hypothetical protein